MQLYLNNSGHRWLDTDRNVMKFVLVLPDGTKKVRKADYYEAFGNFAVIGYRYKGKRYKAFPKSHDGMEVPDPKATGNDALPHIFVRG